MKKILKTALIVGVMLVSSCDLDLQQSPNSLTPEQASSNFILNNLQVSFANFFQTASDFGMENTRMVNMFGSTYENAYSAQTFDGIWENAYASILNDAKTLIPKAKQEQLFMHAGIAEVIQAYTMVTLVDYFGDVPYSQALDPKNVNPGTDSGAEVYNQALTLLDNAIADFNTTSLAKPANDLYYGGVTANWIALANTLKLKIYLQRRLVDTNAAASIEALLTANLIDTKAEDFEFKYSTNNLNPDARHPYFTANYISGAADYMSNHYMWMLYQEKGIVDPRLRYYIYRQVADNSTNVNELPCINVTRPAHYDPSGAFCAVDDGYWGRDHLDDDGIPPDNLLRATFGLYPVGGRFDADDAESVEADNGAEGAGIQPIMLSSFTEFMKAEAALVLNTTGSPIDLMESGIRKSIDKVMTFNAALVDPAFVPTNAAINAYVTFVRNEFTNAADEDEQLGILVREYFLALFGNGIEAYNTYRRTGKPDNLQPALLASAGQFYRSFTYPSAYVNRNNTASQKVSPAVQVFWDTNPAGFVD